MSRFLPFLILSILVLLFFGKTLTGKEFFTTPDFGGSDIFMAEYPAKLFLSQSLKNHQLPLWQSQIATGFPQLATITGSFNPINLVLYYFLPTPLAFNLTLALAFLISAIFTFLYCQSIRLSKMASTLASFSFSFSGIFVTQIVHASLIQTLSFFPVELYLLETYIQKRKIGFALFFAFALGLQILAGFYQIVLYSLIVLAFYILIRLLKEKNRLQMATPLILATICGFLIGSIQLLPSWELTKISSREKGPAQEELKKFPYPPKHLITFIHPYLLGDPRVGTYPRFSENWGVFWENTGYLGVIPLILAPFALIQIRRHQYILIFVAILTASILLMLGKYSPTFFLYSHPPLSLFRVPARFIIFATFALCMLAAFGFSFLQDKLKGRTKAIIPYIILALAIGDLFFFAANYHARGPTDKWLAPTQTADFLNKDKSLYRIWGFGNELLWTEHLTKKGWRYEPEKYLSFLEALDPNYNTLFGISHVANYSIIQTQREKLQSTLRNQITINDGDSKNTVNIAKKFLDASNVKYLISPFEMTGDNLELVFKSQTDPVYFIHQNKSVFPRAFVTTDWRLASSGEQYQIMTSDKFDPAKTALLEKPISQSSFESHISSTRIISYTNQKVEIEATTDAGGILVLSDSYYPGWQAYVDGHQVEILAANINQRAVVLDKGRKHITFIYNPKSLKFGAMISITTLIILLTLLAVIKLKGASNRL